MRISIWGLLLGVSLAHCSFVLAEEPRQELRQSEEPAVQKVNFERHLTGLLRRLGCNAGACHGSFQGQGAPQQKRY